MVLDLYQCLRSLSVMVRFVGHQFNRSRKFVEIDITYRCNLKCTNCNRSCSQAPSGLEMPVDRITDFIRESIQNRTAWERIRLLGGEPTLHKAFARIVDALVEYKHNYNPELRIEVCTNGHGTRVHQALDRLPEGIQIKSTYKNGSARLFRPFNLAPIDSPWFKLADFSSGCRIIADCGIGLTPLGFYPCAIAGGIDRIFGFNLGRKQLPADNDDMLDLLRRFCPLCGHFGFRWPGKRTRMSLTWKQAYIRYRWRKGC